MLIRNIASAMLTMLRLLGKQQVWIAFASVFFIGVIIGQLRMTLLRLGPPTDIWAASVVEISRLFGWMICALVALILARLLAEPRTLGPIRWFWFLGINLAAVVFQLGANFIFGYAMSAMIEADTFRAIGPWFSLVLLWLLFLPLVWAVSFACGRAGGFDAFRDRSKGLGLAWYAGFILIVFALAYASQLLSIDPLRLPETSMTMVQLVAALNFAVSGMVPWLFAITAEDSMADDDDASAAVFA